MLKKELITREEHKTDTRAKTIQITETGQEILKKAVNAVEDFDESFFNNLKNTSNFNQELIHLLEQR